MTNSDKPVRYFTTVSCVYLTCHSLTGKKLIFCFRRLRRNTHGIWNSLLLDRNLIYISFSQVLELWLGYEYCLDARGVTQTFTLVALCQANRRSSDRIMENLKKSAPFVCGLKHIFRKTIFLTGHRNYEYDHELTLINDWSAHTTTSSSVLSC
jgi:hypothetical protein